MIKIWFCCFIIFLNFIGYIFVVYDGCKYVFVYVIEDMVGYKLGEFVFICIFKGYVVDDKKIRR